MVTRLMSADAIEHSSNGDISNRVDKIAEKLEKLKSAANSYTNYAKKIAEISEIIKHDLLENTITTEQVFSKTANILAFGNKISQTINKVKTGFEDFNSKNREGYSDLLFNLESLTTNFTFFVEQVAGLAKECYNTISLPENKLIGLNNMYDFKGTMFYKN